jgi:hypothetical protein
MSGDLEWVHNLSVSARLLLNGENDFCLAYDFNELAVAKMSLRQPLRYGPRRAQWGKPNPLGR